VFIRPEDLLDDNGDLHLDVCLEELSRNLTYGCGIYTFKKK